MKSTLALLPLVSPALAVIHEQLTELPYGWTSSTRAVSDSNSIQLQVALSYSNLDQLESLLKDVSDPSSPKYGKYLDKDDLDSIFAPSTESADAVTAWLTKSGADNVYSDGATVTFRTTVGQANSMLSTKFQVYTDGAVDKLRTTQYSIPDELAQHVDFVSPTIYFGGPQAHGVIPRAGPAAIEKRQLQMSCLRTTPYTVGNRTRTFDLIGPACLKELYNIGEYSADVSSGSTIAFGNFLNESASFSDLAQFEQIYGIPSQNFSILAVINGGTTDQDPLTESDGEANLDVQNIIGLVDGLPVGAYYTGGLPPFQPDLLTPDAASEQNEPYLEYYQYLLSQPNSNLPYVISNSYGDHENTVPEYYAKRVCNMIGMMGLRGRTILESSGDEGVGAVCLANGLTGPPQFTPQFPGTCPYVTAVGGTQGYNPEEAWNASSGGFSNYFSTPWYQQSAVNTYLNSYISAATKQYYSSNNYANFSGRGFPDISAHSLYPDYLTVINGTATPNGGTSAAAPVVAAIMALLNDARFRAGQPAIGFANPWLYSIAGALNDITEGAAVGCSGTDLQNGLVIDGAGIIPYASWNATIGWDPVTGLGTPNFVQMMNAAPSSSSKSSSTSAAPSASASGWSTW